MGLVLGRLHTREAGFGLVELLIAMTVLNVGILAMIAAFNSGALALRRADRVSTAAVLADRQMELMRAIKYEALVLDATEYATAGSDPYYPAGAPSGPPEADAACVPLEDYCTPIRTVPAATSPNGHPYRVDTYIVEVPDAEQKRIRIIVRDGDDLSRVYVREESTFHSSTGS
jgi:type II secretory pathway pseudopilin PulG